MQDAIFTALQTTTSTLVWTFSTDSNSFLLSKTILKMQGLQMFSMPEVNMFTAKRANGKKLQLSVNISFKNSVHHTNSRFSGCDELLYLMKISITPDHLIANNPENYTPTAIARLLGDNPNEKAFLDDLLSTIDFKKLVKPSSKFQRKSDTTP